MKDNFLPGRIFNELTDLNYEAMRWCDQQNCVYHRAVDCVPSEMHSAMCMKKAGQLEAGVELSYYLCPERRVSFDGFVNYEGRRFGVPYWYTEKNCRVRRDGYILYIYDTEMTRILMTKSVYEQIQDDAKYLELDLNAKEMAQLATTSSMSEENIQAVADILLLFTVQCH